MPQLQPKVRIHLFWRHSYSTVVNTKQKMASEEERQVARDRIFHATRQLEQLVNPQPASDESIHQGVDNWENKKFQKLGTDRTQYVQVIEEKCQAILSRIRIETASRSLVHRNIPVPPQQRPIVPAVETTVWSDGVFRERLGKLRSAIVVATQFSKDPQLELWRVTFTNMTLQISEFLRKIKQQRLTAAQILQSKQDFRKQIEKLEAQVKSRMDTLMRRLKLSHMDDLYQMDTTVMALLEREVEVNGVDSLAKRAREASFFMGGREWFKHAKMTKTTTTT